MSQPAVFRATVQSYRSAASRGMFQIVLEVPEEQTPEVTTIAPRGSWVVVAALAPEAAAPATSGQEREVSAPPAPFNPDKRRWSELPLYQQASMRCREPRFRKFLEEECCGERDFNDEESAAAYVREYCMVISRRDISCYPEASMAWNRIEDRFQAWLRGAKAGVPS